MTPALRILVVEDDPLQQQLLKTLVETAGYSALSAGTGAEALAVFQREQPDVVLLDYELPDRSGLQLIREFRARQTDWLPILFLSAHDEIEVQRNCLIAGGDDYIVKPYDFTILEAKIQSLCRLALSQRRVREQARALEKLVEQEQREADAAHYLYERLITPSNKQPPHCESWIKPATRFSGDIICSAIGTNGHHYFLLADATGHGLSAAIGLIPVTQVFHSMTRKGHQLSTIAREMNRQIRQFTPSYRFVAAILVQVDPFQQRIDVWNGGMPHGYLIGATADRLLPLRSRHMAFGLVSEDDFRSDVESLPFQPGDQLLLHSDGLTEAEASSGQRLGTEALESLLQTRANQLQLIDIQQLLDRHLAGAVAHDDIAIVLAALVHQTDSAASGVALPSASSVQADCALTIELHNQLAMHFDLLPTLVDWCRQVGVPEPVIPKLHTVMMELVTNAVDHGLLRLDSTIKESADGFLRYLEERMRRQQAFQAGSVTVAVRLHTAADGLRARIRVQDSGEGFDTMQLPQHDADRDSRKSGRGLALVRQHCTRLHFEGKGNVVEAELKL